MNRAFLGTVFILSAVVPAAAQLFLPCGSTAGARFNLEPRPDPLPQNGTAVDFLPGAGLAGAQLDHLSWAAAGLVLAGWAVVLMLGAIASERSRDLA